MTDLYKILGVSPTATQEEIKTAYRRLARRYHPDVAGNDETKTDLFKEAAAAYAILGQPRQRARYDRERAALNSSGKSSVFGPFFDELVHRVNREGIKPDNVDDLWNQFMDMTKDVQQNLPSRIVAETSTAGGILDFIERLTDIKIEVRPPGTRKKR